MLIDFHTQVFPPFAETAVRNVSQGLQTGIKAGFALGRCPEDYTQKIDEISRELGTTLLGAWSGIKMALREAFVPLARYSHEVQAQVGGLPNSLRSIADEIGLLSALPHLLLESSSEDQARAMTQMGIDYAITVASPPWISSDFALALAKEDPRRIPAIALDKNRFGSPVDASALEEELTRYHQIGVRVLKIYPETDDSFEHNEFYIQQLKFAEAHGWIALLHSGLSPHLLRPQSRTSSAIHLTAAFATYPKLTFVLAHMGMHESHAAIEIAKQNPNVYLTTSWQPAEVIARAVHALGASRILFASDWPMLGENMNVGIARLRELEDNSLLTSVQTTQILGVSARSLLTQAGLSLS